MKDTAYTPEPGARPTPADAKHRSIVWFRSGKFTRKGTLTYWPGTTSTRPPTVIGANGHRYHPNREEVTLTGQITPKLQEEE